MNRRMKKSRTTKKREGGRCYGLKRESEGFLLSLRRELLRPPRRTDGGSCVNGTKLKRDTFYLVSVS